MRKGYIGGTANSTNDSLAGCLIPPETRRNHHDCFNRIRHYIRRVRSGPGTYLPMQFSTISPRKWKCQGDGDMVLPRSLRSHLLSHPDTLDFSDYSNISTYQIISFPLTMPIPHIFRRSPRIAVPPSPKLTASPTTPSPKTPGTSTPTTYPIPTHRELSQTEIEMIQFQLLFPQFEIIPYDKLF